MYLKNFEKLTEKISVLESLFWKKKYEKLATLFKGDTSQGIFLCLLQI